MDIAIGFVAGIGLGFAARGRSRTLPYSPGHSNAELRARTRAVAFHSTHSGSLSVTSNPSEAGSPSEGGVELVTFCAWTRSVRHEGEWMSVERYLQRRFGVVASHGKSPQAVAQFEGVESSQPTPGNDRAEEKQPAQQSPRRLAALRTTGLLDSTPTRGFDRLTRLGSRVLDVPATFISLVDEHRDFYLSNCGFGEPLASNRQLTGQTLCHFTIENEVPLVIPDTRAHPVYRNVPTVESLGVAAYLGAPLVLLSGEVIGAFCAIDMKPREWTALQVQDAVDLASLVVSEIELRQAAIASNRPPEESVR